MKDVDKAIIAFATIVILVATAAGIALAMNHDGGVTPVPPEPEDTIYWKAVKHDGYSINGARDSATIGDPCTDMSKNDLVIKTYEDSSFVTATYREHTYVGIYTNGYMEIKGTDGDFESIMYGFLVDNNTLYVIYMDVPSDLTEKNGSLYVCYYTLDGTVPSLPCKTLEISDWQCFNDVYEMATSYKEYDDLGGTSINVATYNSDTGTFYGSFDGVEGKFTAVGLQTPEILKETIGCDLFFYDSEYDLWQGFFKYDAQGNPVQMTMYCTWYGQTEAGDPDAKTLFRIYGPTPDVEYPKTSTKIDYQGTWVEKGTTGIKADGTLFKITEPSGFSFTLKHGETQTSFDVLFAGTCSQDGTSLGVASAYSLSSSSGDWMYLRFFMDGDSDHFNHCTVQVTKDSAGNECLLVYQSYWTEGSQKGDLVATYSYFYKEA